MAGKVLIRNRRDVSSLEEGDLIEFKRNPLYSHWAVYIGNEEVVHLSGIGEGRLPSNSGHVFTICGIEYDKACVKKDSFWDVVGNSEAYKNNLHDGKERVLRKAEIVMNAIKKIGAVGYNIITKNCEHFATFCRYGKAISKQVRDYATYGALGAIAGGVLAIMFGGDKKK